MKRHSALVRAGLGRGAALAALLFAAASQMAAAQPVLHSPVACQAEQAESRRGAANERPNLVLVPVDGFLYPATPTSDGDIETNPPRMQVRLAGTRREMTPAISSVVEPQDVDPQAWTAQRRSGSRWSPVNSFTYASGRFFVMTSSTTFKAIDPSRLRFAPAAAD